MPARYPGHQRPIRTAPLVVAVLAALAATMAPGTTAVSCVDNRADCTQEIHTTTGLQTDDTQFCNLSGNWTSAPEATPPVHIEFFQPIGSRNFTVRADGWGTTVSQGVILPDNKAAIWFVGGSWNTAAITTSAEHNPGKVTCSQWANWCRFPHCAVPEPAVWPPFPPAVPPKIPIPPYVPPMPSPPPPPPAPPLVPTWTPEWQLNRSTIFQTCNSTGYVQPELVAKFGLVSFDWTNARALWMAAKPHDCEERLVEQCRMVKAVNPSTKCFVCKCAALQCVLTASSAMLLLPPTCV